MACVDDPADRARLHVLIHSEQKNSFAILDDALVAVAEGLNGMARGFRI